MELTGDRRGTALGFLGALVVLAVLVVLVGVDDLTTALAGADRAVVAVMVPVALAWLLCWGMALRTVLGVLGVPVSVPRAFATFAAATFANNVTPFGQAGGEPVTALFIASSTDTEYETGLAAIASVDALNFVPSIGFALLGLGYYATQFTVGRRLRLAAVAVLALALVVPALGYLGWQRRDYVEGVVVRVVGSLLVALNRVVPRVTLPDRTVLRRRVDSFFEAIERVATDRRQLAVALSFSALGWLGIMTSLWLALFALGHVVSFAVVLIAVPVAALSGVAPLPGGLGGVETLLVALLVPIPGISPAVAAAAVALHRGATYWLPLLLGAAAAGRMGGRELL